MACNGFPQYKSGLVSRNNSWEVANCFPCIPKAIILNLSYNHHC